MYAFDRRTDGGTEFSSLDRVSIPCSAVKIKHTPTLIIILPYKALPNSILSSNTSIGNTSILKLSISCMS